MPQYYSQFGEAAGAAMAHNARMAAEFAVARAKRDAAAPATTTPPPLTDQQLAAIRTRADAATPGPWSDDGHEIYQGTPDDYTRHSLWIGETCNIDLPDRGDANGAFLAHARQDVPLLLAEVDRLRAERDQARAELATARRQAEAAHCRLHHIEAYVQEITAADDPIAIGLDLVPWLDGPLHRDDLATYRAAAGES